MLAFWWLVRLPSARKPASPHGSRLNPAAPLIVGQAAAQRSHDQRHRPGCRRAKHQESQNCIRMNHDIIKMKQALVGPRLVDQPGPYGLGPRERWFRNPPAKCAENGRRFHY